MPENKCMGEKCCCNCGNHYEDFYHCSTLPKPKDKEGCVCSVHKGWICLIQIDDISPPVAHSGWKEHSLCELWIPKK